MKYLLRLNSHFKLNKLILRAQSSRSSNLNDLAPAIQSQCENQSDSFKVSYKEQQQKNNLMDL